MIELFMSLPTGGHAQSWGKMSHKLVQMIGWVKEQTVTQSYSPLLCQVFDALFHLHP